MAKLRWNHTPLSSIIIDEKTFEQAVKGFKKFAETINKIIMEEKDMANKFKVGDMVIGNDKADRRYLVTKKGWIGRVINKNFWDSEEDIRVENANDKKQYVVNPDCFDLYIPHEGKILIMVDEKDTNKIIARDLITKKTAEAKCNPKDEFDFVKGAKLALERLYPEKKEEEKPKYWSGKVVCVKENWHDALHYKHYFTVGKVYEVKDGKLYDDIPPIPYMSGIINFDQLNGRYSFIEFKGTV